MIDLRLYALVDPERSRGDLAPLARAVVDGGATLIQLRDKHGDTHRLIEEARAIKAALAGTFVPLLINDRVDVALAAGADGVHIGQDDMSAEDARRLLGREAIIGLSIGTLADAEVAPVDLVDYLCVGAVYPTGSKGDAGDAIGVDGLRKIISVLRKRAPNMPIGAISGITVSNAAEVIAAGADGVAVISALSLAPDPKSAAQDLRAVVDKALTMRVDP